MLFRSMRHAKVDPFKTPTSELSPEDIRSLTNRISVTPTDTGTTGYLLGQLVAPSATALDQGDFLFHLHIAAARSALPLMARFCHLDNRLEDTLSQCARIEDEASQEICLAENV